MRALIYCRISKDREGAGLGVERQQRDCEQLAEALGWTVVRVYADNDISAYSGKARPQYRAMLDALRDGEAQALIAWHTDRLHRSPSELEEFISLCESKHVSVRTVQAGELDLSTPAGQMTARIVGAVARHEIDHARKRMLAARAQAAEKGRAHGRLPWGYQAVVDPVSGSITNRIPHPENAPLIREAVKRILAGETAYAVAKTFNDRGIPTPQGGARWHTGLVSAMVQSPTYAGFRSHKGVVTKGTWEPIVTAEDHEKLVALLSSRGRVMHRGTEPKYLLSGIAVCGVCGAVVHRNKSHGYDAYTCSANTRCVSRSLPKVDAAVEAAIVALCRGLSRPVRPEADSEAEVASREAEALRERLDGFITQAVDGSLSPATLQRIEADLLPKIEEAERRARPKSFVPGLDELFGEHAADRWGQMPLLDRRNVVRHLVTVTILPAKKGTRFRLEDLLIRRKPD